MAERKDGLRAVSLDAVPTVTPTVDTERPQTLRHLSTPAYNSPSRHHTRAHSTPREVKETLNARSEYSNSGDDGQAQHRINQYVIKQEIGRGSFGAVHLAVDQFGNEYAVKEFSKSRLRKRAQSHILRRPGPGRRPGHLAAGTGLNSPLHRRSASDVHKEEEGGNPLYLIREEIAIMKKLNHHNLVQLIEVLDDPEEDSLYMVLEMCKKGVIMKVGLDEVAAPYNDEDCRCWFRDLILGIEYRLYPSWPDLIEHPLTFGVSTVHAQGVVHRDIKPDNLLLTNENVLKIVDFGVSEMFEKASEMLTAKSAGSPAFLPPELCVIRHGEISGKGADIWSMGVTLYCLRFGKLPFERIGVMDLYESIRSDELTYPANVDREFVDLMEKLLEKDPTRRIQMHELREHPWVTKSGTDRLLSSEENTADLVELPTDAELKNAITRSVKHAIIVMKAVKQFKNLIFKKRSHLTDGILGGEIRIVHPPRSMTPPREISRSYRSGNLNMKDRQPAEQNSSMGVHANADAPGFARPSPRRMDSAVAMADDEMPDDFKTSNVRGSPSDIVPSPSENTTGPGPVAHERMRDLGKGHAHDPLAEDPLYLHVGPGGGDAHLEPSHVVSESPPATDINVYETAYREEVERIRKRRGRGATVYLTRRVDSKAGGGSDESSMAAQQEKVQAWARGEVHNAQ
ncbi:MAG: hypothetical protein M1840_006306 [Geoglossum simile]|nr:MAG: hypothetical protein M1840_006306 [Geoglossum simile]